MADRLAVVRDGRIEARATREFVPDPPLGLGGGFLGATT